LRTSDGEAGVSGGGGRGRSTHWLPLGRTPRDVVVEVALADADEAAHADGGEVAAAHEEVGVTAADVEVEGDLAAI